MGMMTPKLVLVVDDESDMRFFTAKLLEGGGCQAATAASGAEGLRIARQNLPDLILLSVMVNAEGGLELFNELKKDESLKRIPVILLSNIDERTLRQLGVLSKDPAAFRPEGFLIKPPEAEDLLDLVERLT